eukprot:5990178-Amphidinium_carterae.1
MAGEGARGAHTSDHEEAMDRWVGGGVAWLNGDLLAIGEEMNARGVDLMSAFVITRVIWLPAAALCAVPSMLLVWSDKDAAGRLRVRGGAGCAEEDAGRGLV